MSDIKIIIGAEIKELEQKLAVAKAKLISFGQEGPRSLAPLQDRLKGLTFPAKEFINAITNTENGLKNLTNAANVSANKIQSTLVDAAGESGESLNELAEGFKEAGIAGAGMAAVSIVVGFAIKKLVDYLKETTDAQKRLAEQQRINAKLTEEAVQSYAKEASSLTIIRTQIESTNVPMAKRLQAIKDLKEQYPEYFKGLTNEELLTGKVATAYDLAAAAILRKSRANAAASAIEEIAAKKLTLILANQADAEKTNIELAKARDKIITKRGTSDAAGTQITNTAASQKAGILIAYNLRRKAAQQEIDDLNYQQNILLKIAVAGANETIKIEKDKVKSIKKVREDALKQIPDFSYFNPDTIKRITGAGLKPTLVLKPKIKIEISPEEQQKVLDGMQKLFDAEKLEAFQQRASEAVSNTIASIASDSISMATEAIGEAIAGNTEALPNLFEGLMKNVGSQIKELGKYLVEIGIKFLLTKKALDGLTKNPYTAIAVGAALQVLGSALVSSFNKKANKGFATGVRNLQEGGVYNVGERGPETIYLPRGSSVRPNNEVNAYGGGNMVFIPAVSLRGSDLVIAFNRASQSMSRNG